MNTLLKRYQLQVCSRKVETDREGGGGVKQPTLANYTLQPLSICLGGYMFLFTWEYCYENRSKVVSFTQLKLTIRVCYCVYTMWAVTVYIWLFLLSLCFTFNAEF